MGQVLNVMTQIYLGARRPVRTLRSRSSSVRVARVGLSPATNFRSGRGLEMRSPPRSRSLGSRKSRSGTSFPAAPQLQAMNIPSTEAAYDFIRSAGGVEERGQTTSSLDKEYRCRASCSTGDAGCDLTRGHRFTVVKYLARQKRLPPSAGENTGELHAERRRRGGPELMVTRMDSIDAKYLGGLRCSAPHHEVEAARSRQCRRPGSRSRRTPERHRPGGLPSATTIRHRRLETPTYAKLMARGVTTSGMRSIPRTLATRRGFERPARPDRSYGEESIS